MPETQTSRGLKILPPLPTHVSIVKVPGQPTTRAFTPSPPLDSLVPRNARQGALSTDRVNVARTLHNIQFQGEINSAILGGGYACSFQ